MPAGPPVDPVITIDGGSLAFAKRSLWSGIDLQVAPSEFVAVLGPNGSGKTSLLKVLLGLTPLTSGTITVAGRPPKKGSSRVGYIPQQKGFDTDLGARGRDLISLGADGHRFGRPWSSRSARANVQRAIDDIGAAAYADRPVGLLSGGEAQRLRIAQALLGDPDVLLCDEPLLSLDPANQQAIVELIDRRRREHHTAVVFVTHEINPILNVVDRILYLVDGRWISGPVAEVMTSDRLSALYGTDIEVIRSKGRLVVVGSSDAEGGVMHEHDLP